MLRRVLIRCVWFVVCAALASGVALGLALIVGWRATGGFWAVALTCFGLAIVTGGTAGLQPERVVDPLEAPSIEVAKSIPAAGLFLGLAIVLAAVAIALDPP